MSEEAFVPKKLQIFFFENNSSVKIKNRTLLCNTPTLYAFLLFQTFFLSHLWCVTPIRFPTWLLVWEINFLHRVECVLPVLGGKRVDSGLLRFLYCTINKGFICPFFFVLRPALPLFVHFHFTCFFLSIHLFVTPTPISCSHLCVPLSFLPPCFSSLLL